MDSIFQQVNKYVMVYEDLSFASNLVYITSAAAATVLLLTFLGLYCAPNGVELRTVAFFETTITAVLAASCTVQLSLALYWDHARWVVETCAFVGAMMGNIQAFIIYPFFNAFYRTELLGAMNVGETSTSLFCGVLALAQSPSAGVENFSVTTYFGIVFAGAFIASPFSSLFRVSPPPPFSLLVFSSFIRSHLSSVLVNSSGVSHCVFFVSLL